MAEVRRKPLSIAAAAEQLGVSIATLRRSVDSGKIQAIRLPSGYRRFDHVVIERFRREMGMDGEDGER